MAPLPALAESFRYRAVAARDFFHHQRLGDEINPVSAAFLGHDGGAKTEPGAFLDNLPIEGLARVGNHVSPFQGDGSDLLGREFSRLIAPRLLFFVQIKIHKYSPSSMKEWRAYFSPPVFYGISGILDGDPLT